MCWNKGRLCWKIAKMFYFCHLKNLVSPEYFGPCYVRLGSLKQRRKEQQCRFSICFRAIYFRKSSTSAPSAVSSFSRSFTIFSPVRAIHFGLSSAMEWELLVFASVGAKMPYESHTSCADGNTRSTFLFQIFLLVLYWMVMIFFYCLRQECI